MSTRTVPSLVAAALLAAAAGQPVTLGASLNWNNAAGGSAAAAGNWNPNQLPGSADDLTYSLAATYAVSFGGTTAASRTQTFRQGTVTVTMSSPHTTSTGVTIGDLAGDAATTTFTTGTWNSTASVVIGDALGATGTLNVNDDDADLIINGVGADLIVGSNGSGTMSVTGGGLVNVADQFVAGNNASSISSVTVSGFVALAPFPISRLNVQGTGVSRFGQGGDATVNILNGAIADFAGGLVIANGSASTSTVTVQGQGIVFGATLDVAGDLLMGRNTTAGSAGGTATLNVNNSGRVLVGGTMFVAGDPDGGTAMLHMEGSSLVRTSSLAVGGGGALDLDQGELEVDGGTFTWSVPGVPAAINGGAGNPTVTLLNGATASFSRAAPGGSVLTVGGGVGANSADFDVRSGSDLLLSDGIFTLGAGADDGGSMIVNGAGSTLTIDPVGSAIVVGDAGAGYLEAEIGGAIVGDDLFIAADPGSTGTALFENPATTADFNQVYVGGNTGIAGGVGVLIVNHGAVLSMTDAAPLIRVYPTSTLDVTGATIDAPGATIDLRGRLSLQGSASVDALVLSTVSGADIDAHPDFVGVASVSARVDLAGGASLNLINGNLTIGDSSSTAGFVGQSNSTISIGANALTLHDADEAQVGAVNIAGGSLSAANGIEIALNMPIDGFGTINGDVFFNSGGSVITATAGGITINGLLENNSGTIDGTRYVFGQNPDGTAGGWTGAGSILARTTFNSNTALTSVANMSVGNAAATDGVVFNSGSSLIAGPGDVITLHDANGLGLPTTCKLDGATIACAQPLSVAFNRRLEGSGTVRTPQLVCDGEIAPGHGSEAGIGLLRFTNAPGAASVTLDTAARLRIDVDGPLGMGVGIDGIEVEGPVVLNGQLVVTPISNFQSTSPRSWPIISASSITGAFGTLSLPPRYSIRYTLDTVFVEICPADINSSGSVTVQDIFDFLAAYFGGNPAADFNGSGAISVQDIFDYLAAYFAGC